MRSDGTFMLPIMGLAGVWQVLGSARFVDPRVCRDAFWGTNFSEAGIRRGATGPVPQALPTVPTGLTSKLRSVCLSSSLQKRFT